MSSRTPVNGVGYDQSLLADAPQVTKADKQEGYNPDLLESQPNPRATPVSRGGTLTPSKPKYAGASEDGHPIRTGAISQPPSKKAPSRKLIFIIVGIVLIVVVAVGVGVGVGVGLKKSTGGGGGISATQGGPAVVSNGTDANTSKSDSSIPTKDPNPSTTDDGVGQGVGTGALPTNPGISDRAFF